MNTTTTARYLTPATAAAALLAAALLAAALLAGAFLLPAAPARAAAGAAQPIVQLPRVVVTGSVQRLATTVVQLPRVVVTGRRVDRLPTALVQAPAYPSAAKQGT